VTLVAAYQAPLLPAGSMEAIGLIEKQVRRCESLGVSILCCQATALFIPTNSGMPHSRADPSLVKEARAYDVARAAQNNLWWRRPESQGSDLDFLKRHSHQASV
jgi:hypothetical protein